MSDMSELFDRDRASDNRPTLKYNNILGATRDLSHVWPSKRPGKRYKRDCETTAKREKLDREAWIMAAIRERNREFFRPGACYELLINGRLKPVICRNTYPHGVLFEFVGDPLGRSIWLRYDDIKAC